VLRFRTRAAELVTCLAVVVAGVACASSVAAAAAALPDGRAYELVSPPNKSGADVMDDSARTRASVSGDRVTFSSLGGFGDVIGTGIATEYMSSRATSADPGNNGWATHSITPRQRAMTLFAGFQANDPLWEGQFSGDLSSGVFRAWSPLTDAPSVANVENLYVRHDLDAAGQGTYELASSCPRCDLTSTPLPISPPLGGNLPRLAGASADFEKVIFESRFRLTSDAPVGTTAKLYESDHGAVRLVGILPNGSVAPRSIAGAGAGSVGAPRYTSGTISRDGSRVIFTVGASNGATSGALYMRDDHSTPSTADDTTVQLNTFSDGTPGSSPATYWAASTGVDAVGARVPIRVFFTTSDQLVSNDTNTSSDVYMWDEQPATELERLTVAATSGTFTLTYGGQTTAPLAFNATGATVESAVNGLSSVGGAGGSVTVTGGPGDAAGTAPYDIRFGGSLADVSMRPITVDASGLTSPRATASVTTVTAGGHLSVVSVGQPGDGHSAEGVIGTSTDGHWAYFTSAGQLVAGRPAPRGTGIYAWHDGAIAYVGDLALTSEDRVVDLPGGLGFASWIQITSRLRSRVTPDGHHLLFVSHSGSGLTGYDQTGCGSGGCQEVYVYDGVADQLSCASCNPAAPATTDADITLRGAVGASDTTSYLSHPISDDGRWVFFNTAEALVPEDANGKVDAYEYDTLTHQVHLLSSGTDPSNSFFMDASADGKNAFILTRQQLTGWDTDGNYDLYDVRVNGGFPDPKPSLAPCVGDACQAPPVGAPSGGTLGTPAFHGVGDLTEKLKHAKKPTRCKRGFVKKRVKGKVKCVKKKQRHTARHAARHGKGA
jgi:hypothetical protein